MNPLALLRPVEHPACAEIESHAGHATLRGQGWILDTTRGLIRMPDEDLAQNRPSVERGTRLSIYIKIPFPLDGGRAGLDVSPSDQVLICSKVHDGSSSMI